jgi:hypothetical protein
MTVSAPQMVDHWSFSTSCGGYGEARGSSLSSGGARGLAARAACCMRPRGTEAARACGEGGGFVGTFSYDKRPAPPPSPPPTGARHFRARGPAAARGRRGRPERPRPPLRRAAAA